MFISTAQTTEMRKYQSQLSKWKPLPQEKINILNKKFIKSRQTEIDYNINRIIQKILSNDWSTENILQNKINIIKNIKQYQTELEEKPDMIKIINKELNRIKSKNDFITYVSQHNYTLTQQKQYQKTIQEGKEALNTIINCNLQLSLSRISTLKALERKNETTSFEDLLQAANYGLLIAARRYDASQGTKFSTYAVFYIDGQIKALLKKENGTTGMTGMTEYSQKQRLYINTVIKNFQQRYHREPTITEIASITGITTKKIKKILDEPKITTTSIYQKTHTHDANNEKDEETIITDFSPEQNKNTDIEYTIQQHNQQQLIKKTRQCILTTLTEEERKIAYYLSADKKTPLKTILEQENITKEQYDEITKNIKNKITNILTTENKQTLTELLK